MSSILTNNSAMVALQTLQGINQNLADVQGEISTGKRVNSAKDNSAVWAISKVMESDVSAFQAISSSLALGESTVAVAADAAEKITDFLKEMRVKIVDAQLGDVDKIQEDIEALKDQVNSVVSAAQFNGMNLVNGSAGVSVDFLASLDRDNTGGVTVGQITVAAQNLSSGGATANHVFSSSGTASATGETVVLSLDNTTGTGNITIAEGTQPFVAGDTVGLTIGDQSVSYTVSASDIAGGIGTSTPDLVAVGLKAKIDSLGIAGLTVDYDSGAAGELLFTNASAVDLAVTGQYTSAGTGGLSAMSGIDVSTDAAGALDTIETLINTAIDAAAAFGSAQGRMSSQSDFISDLTDSLTSGIGAMVDADMEGASARLQALQVQQQLGVQSLSIANQAPQSILSLFR